MNELLDGDCGIAFNKPLLGETDEVRVTYVRRIELRCITKVRQDLVESGKGTLYTHVTGNVFTSRLLEKPGSDDVYDAGNRAAVGFQVLPRNIGKTFLSGIRRALHN